MRSFGVPVVFDVTHSLQLPGGLGKATGGQAEYIENFARAGVACGVDAVFMEVHDDPSNAPSDGPNQLPLSKLEKLVNEIKSDSRINKQRLKQTMNKISSLFLLFYFLLFTIFRARRQSRFDNMASAEI